MQRLASASEHLDGDLSNAADLAGNLRDLRRINRVFGGVSLSRRAVEALLNQAGLDGGRATSVLDVGTGAADIPLALIENARRRGRSITVVATDSREEVLAIARESPAVALSGDVVLRRADARALPFDDRAFDIAHASMVLHHLDPIDADVAIREMARVSRQGIVLNDLARGWLPWIGAWLLLHVLTRNRFTRHDGPLSVRRAYSLGEAKAMLAAAGLRVVHEESGLLGHRWALAASTR
jgi:ubiquinone/menaquinone biosynthesis C-methylase UbiE